MRLIFLVFLNMGIISCQDTTSNRFDNSFKQYNINKSPDELIEFALDDCHLNESFNFFSLWRHWRNCQVDESIIYEQESCIVEESYYMESYIVLIYNDKSVLKYKFTRGKEIEDCILLHKDTVENKIPQFIYNKFTVRDRVLKLKKISYIKVVSKWDGDKIEFIGGGFY